MDSIKSAVSECHCGCDGHNHSAAYDRDCWGESNHSSERYNYTAWRQHSIFRNGYVVNSDCRRNGHIQPECNDAKRYVDARDWQRAGCAALDDLQSTLPGFIRGSHHSDWYTAYDNLPG